MSKRNRGAIKSGPRNPERGSSEPTPRLPPEQGGGSEDGFGGIEHKNKSPGIAGARRKKLQERGSRASSGGKDPF
jgi:hypothetical protein